MQLPTSLQRGTQVAPCGCMWHRSLARDTLLLHKPTQKCTPMVPAAAHAYSLQCCPRCFSVQRANKLCALTGPLLPPLAQAHLAMPLQVALVHSRQLPLSGGSQVVALNQGTVVKGSVGSKATSSARRMISTYSWSTKYRGLRRTVLTNAAERPGSSDGQVCRDMQAGHKRPVAEQPATERWGWAVVMGMMQAGQRHTLAVLAKGKATISWPPGHSRLRCLRLSLLPPLVMRNSHCSVPPSWAYTLLPSRVFSHSHMVSLWLQSPW